MSENGALTRILPAAEVNHLQKPLLIWDGQCGFCQYWVIRWRQMTGNSVQYAPYQDAGSQFPSISKDAFREAAFLIEPSGEVFRGMGAALRTFTYGSSWSFLFRWYDQSPLFRRLSDAVYSWIARHRPLLWKVTTLLFGKDPTRPRPYWLFGVVLIIATLLVVVFL